VALDSYHDHLTASRFWVNPSGVRRDELLSSRGGGGGGGRGPGGGRGGEGDDSWDPVWQAASAVSDSGWVAEIRIPFGQLRFSPEEVQTWGIQLERRIARTQEQALFAFTPKRERGGVARFGHLQGLRGIRARDRLEVLPYALARADFRQVPRNPAVAFADPFRSGSEGGGGVGADVKFRVTSNFTLDATLNPDFGQVEVDPAEVNLTAFETRFQEKRPFFVEGSEIFRFGAGGGSPFGGGPAQLLYSRRVGRAPQLSVPGTAAYSLAPDNTTILGAAKLTGRTRNGWSIGLLEAVAGREAALFVDALGTRGEAAVEPLSNYFAARVKRDLQGGRTTVGAIATSVVRDLDSPLLASRLRRAAYVGGADFRHEWADRVWSVSGYFSPAYVGGSREAMIATQRSSARYFQRPDALHLRVDSAATGLLGYTGQIDFGKRAGAWQGDVQLTATSPGYEVNDLGFQTAADRLELDTRLTYEETRPGRLFRRWSVSSGPDFSWNYAGDPVRGEARVFVNGQWMNYWSTSFMVGRSLSVYDDRLTRGGPLTRNPASNSGFVNVSTDPRKWYTASGSASFGWDGAGMRRSSVDVDLTFKPAGSWAVQVGPEVSRSRAVAQYVATVADPTALHTFGRRYVFAGLEQTTVSLETRLNVTFTPALSLELYALPFLSGGDYGTLKELSAA
ncbi:MAG: DUF5916 domain-containing protein, partial [Gemmatimonadota bacterium]|nr:DUF5916 domain-containing protein [Gemmatimonadota bacterium]